MSNFTRSTSMRSEYVMSFVRYCSVGGIESQGITIMPKRMQTSPQFCPSFLLIFSIFSKISFSWIYVFSYQFLLSDFNAFFFLLFDRFFSDYFFLLNIQNPRLEVVILKLSYFVVFWYLLLLMKNLSGNYQPFVDLPSLVAFTIFFSFFFFSLMIFSFTPEWLG